MASISLAAQLLFVSVGIAQPAVLWEAFNDYRPLEGTTSPNATTYDLRIIDDGGILRDIKTGADLKVSVRVSVDGETVPDDFGANSNVNPGSPADVLFKDKVVIGGADNPGLPGVRNSAGTTLILNFEGMDPKKRYNFRGTVARGGNYNDRWSVFAITGADAFVHAHVDGSNNQNIFTKATYANGALEPNQVALNSGDNKAGSLVGFDNIEPGPDGTVAIEAKQYVGPAPFGNPSAAPYGYGLNAIYLAEIESTGSLRIAENPASQLLPAGKTAILKVAATGSQTITYQWQKAAPGSSTFADISGATAATYTTPALTTADDGAKYRVNLTSGTIKIASAEATINVDGSIPTVVKVVGSINFNSVYVTFSEAMKLDSLGAAANYTISGGLTITSAQVLDPTTVRLQTSLQVSGTAYTATIAKVEDRAGNPVAANTTARFTGFTVQSGFVGLEIWKSIGGGAVQDLRNNERYPASPDADYSTTTFDSFLVIPAVPDNNTYAGRFRAWLTPEETGDYEFFLRSDDQGELRLSSNDKFDLLDDPNELPLAADTSGGDFQEPGVDPSTTELPVRLEKGKRYAMQAIWKEGNGSDYLQVAWRKVGDATPADQLKPIPSQFLSYYAPANPPEEPKILGIALQAGKVAITWSGKGLQSSVDLVTWKDEAGAASPFSVSADGNKFFRAKN